MVIGEAGAVRGDKPQAHAEKSPSAGSLKAFSEALGAPIEVQSKAPSGPDFNFVEAAPKERYSQFPSSAEFKKELILPALLESSTGLSTVTWAGPFANFGLGESVATNLINRGKGGIDAGSNPVSITGTAATDTFGERVAEKVRNRSSLTGADLKPATGERMTGGGFDLVGGISNGMGAREFAKAPGVGEPSVSCRNSTEPAVNDAPTSAHDTAAIGGKAAATAGRDAGDTIRVRRAGSGEGYRPSDATDVFGSNTSRFTRDIPHRGDTVKMRKIDGADAAKVESSSATGSGAKAGADAAVPAKSVDQIVDAYAKGRSPAEIRNSVIERDTARMKEEYKNELRRNGHAPEIADQISEDQYRHVATAGDIYHHYNQPAMGQPRPTISEAQLKTQLKSNDGPTQSPDGRHVRVNESTPGTPADHSWVNADRANPMDRFDVDLKAGHAPEPADHVVGEPNEQGVKFQLKSVSEVGRYTRADSGFVYTPGKDLEAVRDVFSNDRHLHFKAITEGSPAVAKPVGKGVHATEALLQEGLPVVYPGAHSFGLTRTNLIAEAINQGGANTSVAQAKALELGAKLQRAGFDPDRPWQEPPPRPGGPEGNQGASGDAGGDSNGSGSDRREQRRYRKPGSRQAGSRSSSELDGF
jgi:hypothetical protein